MEIISAVERRRCWRLEEKLRIVYSEDRKSERPAGHLAGFRGVLQVDGYAGFKRLAGDHADGSVTLALCWAI